MPVLSVSAVPATYQPGPRAGASGEVAPVPPSRQALPPATTSSVATITPSAARHRKPARGVSAVVFIAPSIWSTEESPVDATGALMSEKQHCSSQRSGRASPLSGLLLLGRRITGAGPRGSGTAHRWPTHGRSDRRTGPALPETFVVVASPGHRPSLLQRRAASAAVFAGSEARTTRTGRLDSRTTAPATLPRRVRPIPVRPWVLITIRLPASSFAASIIPTAAEP